MELALRTLSGLLSSGENLKEKTVLLRADLNVPMQQGKVSDTTRIERIVPTVRALQNVGARVVVLSHFGRPGGEFVLGMSLAPIADALSEILDERVNFGVDCIGTAARDAIDRTEYGRVVLLENLRFHHGEKSNDKKFAEQLSSLGDYYVNDAFSGSHRAHASIVGVADFLPAYAGLLFEDELTHLHAVLDGAQKPTAAIVGGAKISTKLALLESLVEKMDYLFIGGGMANTFLYAQGYNVGASLCEHKLKKTAQRILKKAEASSCRIMLPVDGVVSTEFKASPICQIVDIGSMPSADHMILDIGPETMISWNEALEKCKTVVWNGPVGAFELTPFDTGSIMLARIIVKLTTQEKIQSVAGGGDVLSALSRAGLRDSMSYISTAGGAFLEWLEGKELPGAAVMMEKK